MIPTNAALEKNVHHDGFMSIPSSLGVKESTAPIKHYDMESNTNESIEALEDIKRLNLLWRILAIDFIQIKTVPV